MQLFIQKKLIIPLFVSLLVVFGYMALFEKPKVMDNKIGLSPVIQNSPNVKIGGTTISVEVASSALEKAEGLSGREELEENTGMLFTWSNKVSPGFWMIDMKFPLDIIWISDNKVVSISENAHPEPGKSPSELKHYFPTEPVNYVLEVNGGFSRKNNIKVGDTVKFNLPK